MAIYTRTFYARSAATLLAQLSNIPKGPSLLYALAPTPTLPPSDLSLLVSALKSVSPSSIGCLSSPVASAWLSLSLAVLDGTPFRSSIPGVRNAQVGRSHVYNNAQDEKVLDLELELPPSCSAFVYLSDAAPQGLTASLSSRFPRAYQVALIGASTPFITGRPYTLFHNEAIYSSGAVGIALKKAISSTTVEYPTLTPLTDDLQVTSTSGNLIHTLNGRNPARILLDAISSSSSTARVFRQEEGEEYYLLTGQDNNRVYSIVSGDPSRGTIALKGEDAPRIGEYVKVYHRPRTPTSPPPLLPDPDKNTLAFLATSGEQFHLEGPRAGSSDVVERPGFLAASENGFLHYGGVDMQMVNVPGALATMSL